MYTRQYLGPVAAALFAVGCRALPARPVLSPEQEVLKAEQDWVDVTLAHNADAFATFVDDSWVGLGSSGAWLTKESWVERIRTGTTHYDSVRLSNLHVRFPRPGTALVTGDFMQKGKTGTRDISTVGRYINTWARTGNRWQLISSGFASTPQPAGSDQTESMAPTVSSPSDRRTERDPRNAANAFARILSLTGTWDAPFERSVITDVFRPIANGSAILHEEWMAGKQLTATLFYVVDGELRADHYCDARNQPRFVAQPMTDTAVIAFTLRNITSLDAHPKHFHATRWTFIDENHHVQDWNVVEHEMALRTIRLEFTRRGSQ